jgi:predicted nucleic acid-binding protein
MKIAAASSIFTVAAHTVAEFYRGGTLSAAEAQLMNRWRVQFLDVSAADGKLAGELLARTSGDNSMDALLVAVAARYQARTIFTGDAADLIALRDALPRAHNGQLAIVDIQP